MRAAAKVDGWPLESNLDSEQIENIKSISDFVAWMEYCALFKEMRPVDIFTSLVYGSFAVFRVVRQSR